MPLSHCWRLMPARFRSPRFQRRYWALLADKAPKYAWRAWRLLRRWYGAIFHNLSCIIFYLIIYFADNILRFLPLSGALYFLLVSRYSQLFIYYLLQHGNDIAAELDAISLEARFGRFNDAGADCCWDFAADDFGTRLAHHAALFTFATWCHTQ